jgi:glycosyltransferase involved in cell wall biosynthesis
VINDLGYGGAERQLLGLTQRSAFEHHVLELERLGGGRLSALRRLAQELERLRPDVVVGWLERPQIALAVAPMRPRPLVACVRGLPRRTRPIDRWKVRIALARFDRYVANSEAARSATRRFARPLSLDDFVVVPNGVDVPAPRPRPPRRGPLRLGFIGRAHRDKGLDVLLAALDVLEAGEVTAALVGPGVPEAVGGRHPADGPLADPWGALGDVELLVVPSRRESSPNVVLEAFARGVPVLATTVGGTEALLAGGRGLGVAPGDAAALAASIRQVVAEPEAALERAERARRYVERVHAWPRVVAAFDALLLDAARANGYLRRASTLRRAAPKTPPRSRA